MSKKNRGQRSLFFEWAEILQDRKRNKELKRRNDIASEKEARIKLEKKDRGEREERETKQRKKKAQEKVQRARESRRRAGQAANEKHMAAQRALAAQRKKAELTAQEQRRTVEAEQRVRQHQESLARQKALLKEASVWCAALRQQGHLKRISKAADQLHSALQQADNRSPATMPSSIIPEQAQKIAQGAQKTLRAVSVCRDSAQVAAELKSIVSITSRYHNLLQSFRHYNEAVEFFGKNATGIKQAISDVQHKLRHDEHETISMTEARSQFSSQNSFLGQQLKSCKQHVKRLWQLERSYAQMSDLRQLAQTLQAEIEQIQLAYSRQHWLRRILISRNTVCIAIFIATLFLVVAILLHSLLALGLALIVLVLGAVVGSRAALAWLSDGETN